MIGPAPGALRHEAGIYRTDAELVAIALPRLREGVAAGDPTLLIVGEHERRLLLDAAGGARGITVLDAAAHYGNPFRTLEATHRLLLDHLGLGRAPVRIVGQIPHAATGWDGWARYEAAVNHVYAPLDVRALCLFDARSTPAEVLADVRCTHPHLAAGSGVGTVTAGGGSAGGGGVRVPNPAYVEPAAFLDERARLGADPLEAGAPHVTRRNPTPAVARRVVAGLAGTTALDEDTVDRLVLAVSELVTNATMHGVPPVDLRAWAGGDRLVVTVGDGGTGPADPFAGYLPQRNGVGGMGLWIVNQACSSVGFVRGPEGFTARVTVGRRSRGGSGS